MNLHMVIDGQNTPVISVLRVPGVEVGTLPLW